MERLESNVWKLSAIQGLRSFMLIMPVMVLFFQENGLSVQDIFLLQALFAVVVIVVDIPTGYFADAWSRKASLIVGGCLSTIGYATYAMSYGFWGFLVAETLIGVGMGFVMGADSAMLYDTLLNLNRSDEYLRSSGRNMGVGLLAESIASVLGGFAALVSLRFPLCLDVATTACIIPIAMSLVEPEVHGKSSRGGIVRVIGIAKHALHGHPQIKWLILYSSFVSASTLTMVWFIQPYLLATHVPIALFGLVWAFLVGVAAFFSWYAQRIECVFGRRLSLILLIALPVAGYGLVSTFWSSWSFLWLLCFYVTRGISNPVLSSYLNEHIASDMRATVLSVKNIFGRLIFVIVGPTVGWVSDTYSLQAALQVSGTIFLLFGGTTLMIMWYKKAL